MAPRTTAPSGANRYVETNALYSRMFSGGMFPISEKYRTRFGKGDVMERINACVQQANMGLMLYLTDLGRETLELDPHTNTVAAKRFGAIAELDWTLTPASGPGIDEKLAAEICDTVNGHLKRMRGLKQAIYDLAWGVFDGRSLIEIDWRYQGGRFPNVPVALEWVHPRRLAFGPHRELCVIDTFRAGISWWTYNGVPVENLPGKFIRWLPRYFNDYSEREGLLRRSLYWIYFKRFAAYERMVFTELYGKPLRVVEWDKPEVGSPPINKETYQNSAKEAESLGGTTTATMDAGAHLKMFWPGGGEGTSDLYSTTVDGVDSQMSRLWLGNEATTVMMPSGMGSQSSVVQSAEQNIYLERDAGEISDRFQQDLIVIDVIMNWGPDFIDHAPIFHLHAKDEIDKTSEQNRLNSAITIGVPVKVSQYAERTGVEIPNEDEKIIVIGDAGKARIVDQAAERAAAKASGRDLQLEVGSISLTPTDMAAVVRVNEARAGQGLPPLLFPSGQPDPDGQLPVSAYRTKMDAMFSGGSGAPGGAPPGPTGGADPGEDQGGEPPMEEPDGEGGGADLPPAPKLPPVAGLKATLERTPIVRAPSPEEPLVKAATREGARLTGAWAALLAAAPASGDKAAKRAALKKAASTLPLAPFAGVVERSIVRGALLGAARAHEETFIDQGESPLPPWRLDADRPDADPSMRPLPDALKDFEKRAILPMALVVAMRNAAKERAAKVAELARQDMLRAAEEEADASDDDDDADDLHEKIADRFESRGWTAENDSHATLVFAVAVGLAYHAGRAAQMDQPAVLAARPYRLVRGIDDAETRPAHGAAHGKALRGDDPFWTRAPLPWGFSERCSAVSCTAADLRNMGLPIIDGATLKGLPDEDFESGGALFSTDRRVTFTRAVRAILLDGLFPMTPPQAATGGPQDAPRPPLGSPALAEATAGLPTGAWPDPTPPAGNEVAVMDAKSVLDAAVRAVPGEIAETIQIGDVLTFSGIPVRIDRPVGFVQIGTGADGTPWTRTYSVPYGEILGTEGGDGKPLDVFCGPAPDIQIAFWAEQKKANGTFDEFKLGLGWADQGAFVVAYLAHIPAQFLGRIWTQPVAQVKALLGLDPQVRAERVKGFLAEGPPRDPVARARESSARAAEASETAADASRLANGGTWAVPHDDASEAHDAAIVAHQTAAADHEATAGTFPEGSSAHAHHLVEAKRHTMAAEEHEKIAEAEQGHAQAKRNAAMLARDGAPVLLDENQPRDKDGRWMAGAAFAGGATHVTKIEGPGFGTGKLDPHSTAKWAGIKAAETGKVVYATPDDRPHSGGFKLATKIGVRDAKKGYSAVHPDGRIVHHNGGAARGKDPVGPGNVMSWEG